MPNHNASFRRSSRGTGRSGKKPGEGVLFLASLLLLARVALRHGWTRLAAPYRKYRLDRRFLVRGVASLAAVAVTVHVLHAYQVRRHASLLREEGFAAGRKGELPTAAYYF